jgi:hypothetical protein
MDSEDMATEDQPAERPVPATPTPDLVASADSAARQETTPESGQPQDVGTRPNSNQAPDVDTPSESGASSAGETAGTSDPSPALEKAAASDPTLERAPAERRRWFVNTRRLRRDLLAFFLPPLLLLLITAIVVTLGSGLLLLGTRELQIGPIVIAWAVVAAALGVLAIGSGALWLATRATD